MAGSRWATRMMTVLPHGCSSSFGFERLKTKMTQNHFNRGSSTMDDLFDSALFLLTFVVRSQLHSFTVSAGAGRTRCSCLAHGIRDWLRHMLSHLWLFGSSDILSAALLSLQRSCWLEPATLKRPLPALAKHEQMFSPFFLPSPSLLSIVQMSMIHPKGNIHTRCRFILREWRFSAFHPRLDRAQPTPRDPDSTFYLSVFPIRLHQPPLVLS